MTDADGLRPGLMGQASLVVGDKHTARYVGSGTVDVFATPMLVALMETAAVDCVERYLGPGQVSLGTRLDVDHRAATPIGARVEAIATLTTIAGRALSFKIVARDEHEVIGEGTHTRMVVDTSRFLAKLGEKRSQSGQS